MGMNLEEYAARCDEMCTAAIKTCQAALDQCAKAIKERDEARAALAAAAAAAAGRGNIRPEGWEVSVAEREHWEESREEDRVA